MGACYRFVNLTRRERIEISTLGVDKASEIVGSHDVSALLIWCMMEYRGEQIAFVSDHDTDAGRPFFGRALSGVEIDSFVDATERVIESAVSAGVIADKGWRAVEGDPSIRFRDVRAQQARGRRQSGEL